MFRAATSVAILALVLTASASGDPIHDAILAGDTATVRQLLDENSTLINAPDTAQNLPLHLAASGGQTAIIELLLSRGTDINAGDRENTTALIIAATRNHPEAVRLIVEKGGSITARDYNGDTPLLAAARTGNLELVRYLVDHGALLADVSSRGSNCLHIAASVGADSLVAYLLAKGMDINTRNGRGYAPLFFAAYNGHTGVIRLLAEHGADVNAADSNGTTPLLQAAYAGKLESIQTLVALGADLNHAPDIHGNNLLMATMWGGHFDITTWLLDHGADWNYRNSEGETMLHVAAARGNIPVAQMLVTKGIDVNTRSNAGLTPLCLAVWEQPEMTRWLIDRGADVNATTDSTGSPLQFAANRGDTVIVRTLLTRGATVNYQNRTWEAPLYLATRLGSTAVVRQLLESGADPNLTALNADRTALHVASIIGKKDLVELLLEHGANVNAKDSVRRTPLYYAARYAHKPAADVLKARGADTKGIEESDGIARELALPIKDGEAIIWYLGHSGWGIKTRNHFLVFDYCRSDVQPDIPKLVNGFIDPNEIAGLPVTVFSSHEHADHYDTVMFSWRDQIPGISYVLGHRPPGRQGYSYVGPHETLDISDMKVSAISATDAGVGFIVDVDGLTIFHAGDHAAGQVDLPPAFTSEIDYVAEHWPKIDLAFMPISGCSLGTPESVRTGDIYSLNKLHPGLFFPQHAIDAEQAYTTFKRLAIEAGVTDSIVCAEHRGDSFQYSPGQEP